MYFEIGHRILKYATDSVSDSVRDIPVILPPNPRPKIGLLQLNASLAGVSAHECLPDQRNLFKTLSPRTPLWKTATRPSCELYIAKVHTAKTQIMNARQASINYANHRRNEES